MTVLPTLFVSHGSPMLLLQDIPARDFFAGLGASLPRPRAIVVASAHWLTDVPAVSTAAKPETVHDFYGFPAELYRVRYPAPGEPDLAREVLGQLRAAGFAAGESVEQGLDHGAWQVLALAYPDADIPVFQLSIQPEQDPAWHLAVGRALASLRQNGVLVIGSGSATHNLRELRRGQNDTTDDWAAAFDDWLAARIEAGDEQALVDYRRTAPNAVRAHPTDEHLLPLYVALGAAGPGARGRRLHASFTSGALSMASYAFG